MAPACSYVSHNGIESLDPVSGLVNLRILDVANNRIKSLEGLEWLTQLVSGCWVGADAGSRASFTGLRAWRADPTSVSEKE